MTLSDLLDFSPSSPESQLTKRLEELKTHSLAEIMTPRSIVVALDADVQLKRVRRLRSSKASYFPVYEGDLDHIIGWISKDKVLQLLELPAETVNIRKYLRPVGRIAENTLVSQLADHFLKSKSPFLVVTNDNGQTVGIVTLSEFVELLFGFELNAKEEDSAATSHAMATPTSLLDRF